jgi:hypothetical protein
MLFDDGLQMKGVPGCQWDHLRNAWVCPRNSETRDALVEFFGQEDVAWLEYDHLMGMTRPCEDPHWKGMPISDGLAQRVMEEDALRSLGDLFDVARQFGFPEDAEYDALVTFTKAAYEGNQRFAEMVARVATLEAQIRSYGQQNPDC